MIGLGLINNKYKEPRSYSLRSRKKYSPKRKKNAFELSKLHFPRFNGQKIGYILMMIATYLYTIFIIAVHFKPEEFLKAYTYYDGGKLPLYQSYIIEYIKVIAYVIGILKLINNVDSTNGHFVWGITGTL